MLKRLLIISLFVSPLHYISQRGNLDSLLKKLDEIKTERSLKDTLKLNLLLGIGDHLKTSGENQKAEAYYNELKLQSEKLIKSKTEGSQFFQRHFAYALNRIGSLYIDRADFLNAWSNLSRSLKIFRDINYKKGEAKALMTIGKLYTSNGNDEKALDYYRNALEINETLREAQDIGDCFIRIGMIYSNRGEYSKAIEYYYKSLRINENNNNKAAMANAYLNMGNTYYQQKNNEKALESYFKTLKIREELGVETDIAAALNNIGNIYMIQSKFPEALDYYFKALKLNEHQNYKHGIIFSLTNIGACYIGQKKFSEGLEFLQRSLKIQEELGDLSGAIESFANIGILYYEQSRMPGATNKTQLLQKSKEHLEKALALSIKTNNQTYIRECYLALSEHNEIAGNLSQALAYYKRYVTLRDSLINEEKTANTIRSEMNYEFEKKESAARAEQERKDLLMMAENEKQKFIRNALIGAFLLALALVFLISWGYRNKRRTNFTIMRQKKEVEQQKHLVEQKQKQIIDSINYAQRIQSSILVSEDEIKNSLPESFVLYLPKDIVSGDFYWFHTVSSDVKQTHNSELLFAVADCTGHGVPGAFLSMVGSTLLNEIVNYKKVTDPAKVIKHLSKGVSATLSHKEKEDYHVDGMDISICKLDKTTGKVFFAGANHSVYCADKNGLSLVESQISSISGIFGLNEKEKLESIELSPEKGTMVYMSTDGYADQLGGEKGKKFLASRFEDLLKTIHHLPVSEQKGILEKTLHEWKGHHKQIDDILVMGFRI